VALPDRRLLIEIPVAVGGIADSGGGVASADRDANDPKPSFECFGRASENGWMTSFAIYLICLSSGTLPLVQRLWPKPLEQIGVLPSTFGDRTRGYNSMCLDCPWWPFTSALAAPPPRS
jgi:hypothetical protein